jgi:molybdopterin/thiamine biosynthesis adenylyltransferase
MGLGHITGIDPDYVDKSNCSRMVGSTRMDAVLSRRKVDVAARMVRRISRKAKFSGIPYAVPHELAVQALKAADIIIGCVDNVRARRDIQDLSWRYLIPYIDIGLIIKPGPHRKDLIISGNVATLIPGHFCLRCWGLLDGIEPQPGYVHGSAAREAQVISFNGVLASQAVSEALQLLTGFAEPETEMAIKKFDGVDGTVQKMIVKKRADCTLCSSVLGSGDAVFRRI